MTARRLPSRLGPPLQAALLSGCMSLIVSGVATWRAIGLPPNFLARWLAAWALAWPIAFSALFMLAPLVRGLVARIVEPPPNTATSTPSVTRAQTGA